MFNKCFTLLLCLSIFSSVVSGQASATIIGSVAESKEPLTGASVIIDSSTIGTTANDKGEFALRNIQPGRYTISVSFIGYEKYSRNIDVAAGANINLGVIRLKPDNKTFNEITVKGKHKQGSETQAIDITKNSQKVVTVISAENIKKLPDKNAADALKRVAGVAVHTNKGEGGYVSLRGTPVDWTSTLINGDRLPVADEENTSRSFEFEVLPADLIDRIEVTRTVTPDMEGDNVGGSINFILKEPVDRRTFVLNSGLGFNLLSQKPTGNINLLWGDMTKNGKFRYVINATARENFYEVDAYKLIYGNNFNHAINRYDLKDYSGNRTNFGTNAGFDWQVSPMVKLGFRGMTGLMWDNKYQNKMSYTYASGDGTTVQPQFIHGLLNRQLFGGSLEAEIKPTSALKIDIKYSSYYNRFFYGTPAQNPTDPRDGYLTAVFTNKTPVIYSDVDPILQNGAKYDPNAPYDPKNPPWSSSKLLDIDNPYGHGDHWTNIQPQTLQPFNANTLVFLEARSETNYTYELDPGVVALDLKYQIAPKVTLQVGAKGRYKKGERKLGFHWWTQNPNNGQNSRDYFLNMFATQPARWKDFLAKYGSNYGNIDVPNMTRDQLNSFIADMERWGNSRMINHYVDSFNEQYPYWVGSTYDYTETQLSGYAMVDATIGKWNIVGGLRVENTRLYEHALDLNFSSLPQYGIDPYDSMMHAYQPVVDSFTRQNYVSILPALNVNYKINDRMNLRGAISRTFHRANFQETKPGAPLIKYQDYLYIKGNPHLKPSYSHNFDLSYQYFWGNKGLLTLSTYGKYIVNHIIVTSTGGIDPLTYFVTKSYGNADAWVWGVEAEIKRKFDFLPRFASGFGIGANITYSYSRMHVAGRPKTQAMSEQSPLLYNVSLLYEKYGVKAALALNYNSPFLLELNLATLPNSTNGELIHKDQDFDIFMGEQYSMDFQISYDFKKHFSVYFEANNLLNWTYKEYVGNPNRPLRVEVYRQRGQVGFRYEL
ncbi:MAG: TonB-dependent receptor [Bacteroidetes bacterium]|nr:TonB-dependent receptor [Bacteroidota bacterium]